MTRSPEEVAELFSKLIWNERRLELLDSLFTETTVTHQLRSAPGPVPSAPRTAEHLRAELSAWFQSFPDLVLSVEQRTVDGELVTSRYRLEGTHTGAWMNVAPTGNRVVIRMVHTQRIRDGRVVEDWLLADWHGFLHQIGLLPSLDEIIATPRDTS